MRVESELFRLALPEGWRWLPDAEGGAAVPPGEPGALVVAAHRVEDPEALPGLRRMLSGFLTESGRPVSPAALPEVVLGSFRGYAWQYEEEREGAEPHSWVLWITGTRAAWCLASYNCPARCLEAHAAELLDILASLELRGGQEADPLQRGAPTGGGLQARREDPP